MPMPSEAPSRGRRERPRCLLRQGRYRLAEKAFSVTLARLHGPLETAGRQMPLPASAALQKRAPHVLIVLIRGRHSYALFGRCLLYMRRKGTPRAKQGGEHVLAVKTDNRQAVDRNNIHMAQCVLKAVKALYRPSARPSGTGDQEALFPFQEMVTARLAPAQAIQKSLQVLGKIVPVDGRDPDNRLGGNESLIVFRKIIIDHAPASLLQSPHPFPHARQHLMSRLFRCRASASPPASDNPFKMLSLAAEVKPSWLGLAHTTNIDMATSLSVEIFPFKTTCTATLGSLFRARHPEASWGKQ